MSAVDGPARLHAGHRQDRGLSIVAGAVKGYRNCDESALSSYADRGLLEGGRNTAMVRVAAGDHYRQLWERVMRSTRDSTQLDIVQSGSGMPLSETQVDAVKALVSIDMRLSANDRQIVRRVCCEGWWPPQAIKAVDPAYVDAVAPRFREALDALIEAMA